MQHAGERRRGAEHAADAGRRSPSRRARPSTAPRSRAAARRRSRARADSRQLPQVERLPSRPVEPVAVEADVAALGHHHQHVAQRRHVLDVGLASPAVVGVAAAVQQVEHRPAPVTVLGPARGRQQPDARVRADGGRADGEVDDPRRDLALVADGRARGRAIGSRRGVLAAAATGDERRGGYQSRWCAPETSKPCPDLPRMPGDGGEQAPAHAADANRRAPLSPSRDRAGP